MVKEQVVNDWVLVSSKQDGNRKVTPNTIVGEVKQQGPAGKEKTVAEVNMAPKLDVKNKFDILIQDGLESSSNFDNGSVMKCAEEEKKYDFALLEGNSFESPTSASPTSMAFSMKIKMVDEVDVRIKKKKGNKGSRGNKKPQLNCG